MNRKQSALIGVLLLASAAHASDPDEFKVKREQVFAFAQKPKVAREGDKVTITFTSKGYCDVTVAIENAKGRIIRHLACGVLGRSAPPPFRKGSLAQTLVWDGKDDAGRYVDDRDGLTVRVSLGLKPRFEQNLFHDPRKRFGASTILLAADREGVYVYDVHGCETVRLYDHRGDYVRTVYPFPADKIGQVKGLPWLTYPDGGRAPAKRGYFLSTLLAGPKSGNVESTIRNHSESSAMALHTGRLALAGVRLNRLGTDGSSGGAVLRGPHVDLERREYRWPKKPTSAAFSPDGKHLYLTGYTWLHPRGWAPVSDARWRHAVYRMVYEADAAPTLFLGEPAKTGSDDAHFDHPAAVVVDRAGRLYVADHLNHRVQVFSPEGKRLRSLRVEGPVRLALHHRTQALYVASWFISRTFGKKVPQSQKIAPKLRTFSRFPELKPQRTYDLPLQKYRTGAAWSRLVGQQYQLALDSWTDPPTLWLIPDGGGYPVLLQQRPGGLVKVRDFLAEAKRSGVRLRPPGYNRQRLYVDEVRGHLYLGEGDAGTAKAFTRLVRIEPETGKCREVALPFTASDMAFSPAGHAYLRTGSMVARYDTRTWREVPFDYGEERLAAYSYDGRSARLVGGLVMPSTKTSPHWHHGGMDVNVRGDLIVTCFNPASRRLPTREQRRTGRRVRDEGAPFRPRLYPGRRMSGHELHVWDKYGKPKRTDILKGVTEIVGGVHLDEHDNVYANVSVSRMLDGKPYYKLVGHRFDQVGTLVKFLPGRGKFLFAAGRGTPVTLQDPPKRPPELNGVWVEGAEWFFPGVGRTQWGMDCSCWNSRFDLDYFARSFAPEYDRCSVAVLDRGGNLITRIGRYGNVDSSGPKSRTPVGGDEVALFDAAYVAVHTDRRLFIPDAGNGRIVSVRLDYYATEKVALKDVPDRAKHED